MPELETMILDEFKPYTPDNYLWQIKKADNIDKHNALVVGLSKVTSNDLNFGTKEGGFHIMNSYTLTPRDRIPVGVSKHPFELFNDPTFRIEFAFGGGNPMTGQNIIGWLRGAHDATLYTLMEIERRFGNLEESTTDGTAIATAEAAPTP